MKYIIETRKKLNETARVFGNSLFEGLGHFLTSPLSKDLALAVCTKRYYEEEHEHKLREQEQRMKEYQEGKKKEIMGVIEGIKKTGEIHFPTLRTQEGGTEKGIEAIKLMVHYYKEIGRKDIQEVFEKHQRNLGDNRVSLLSLAELCIEDEEVYVEHPEILGIVQKTRMESEKIRNSSRKYHLDYAETGGRRNRLLDALRVLNKREFKKLYGIWRKYQK